MDISVHSARVNTVNYPLSASLVVSNGSLFVLQMLVLTVLYSGASLIRTPLIRTHVWEPIPIPQQKVPHLSGNSVIRTVSLETEVSG